MGKALPYILGGAGLLALGLVLSKHFGGPSSIATAAPAAAPAGAIPSMPKSDPVVTGMDTARTIGATAESLTGNLIRIASQFRG